MTVYSMTVGHFVWFVVHLQERGAGGRVVYYVVYKGVVYKIGYLTGAG